MCKFLESAELKEESSKNGTSMLAAIVRVCPSHTMHVLRDVRPLMRGEKLISFSPVGDWYGEFFFAQQLLHSQAMEVWMTFSRVQYPID